MPNVLFELDRLRINLINKGLSAHAVDQIVDNARREIRKAFEEQSSVAMQSAIESGVAKRSPEFINDLVVDELNMRLTTVSGNTDFSDPPFPMLSRLLRNAKPIKDGSGVYKVVPVGGESERPRIAHNIYDAMKNIQTARAEEAARQYAKITPKGSKAVQFRTATSKQDPSKRWVMPATDKDFTDDVRNINVDLSRSMDSIVMDIVRNYEESF